MDTVKTLDKSSPFMSLLNFMGLGLMAGMSSAIVLAGIVLLIATVS